MVKEQITAETETGSVDQILRKLFTNGAGQQADRLLLVKDELHRYAATVINAQYLGGYSREAVRSILQDALSPSDTEQLVRLRDGAKNAIELIELGQYRTAVDRLREALQVKA